MAVIPAAGTVPWRRAPGPARGRPGAPAQVRRLVLGQGQARPGRGLGRRRRPRDRTRRPAWSCGSGARCPSAATPSWTATASPPIKEVRYWAAEVTGGGGPLAQRDRRGARGSTSSRAHDLLDYARDREQLRAVVRADSRPAARRPGRWRWCATPRRSPRSQWKDPDDQLRPLDRHGRAAGQARSPACWRAYGVRRLRQLAVGALRRHHQAVCRAAGSPAAPQGRAVRGGLRGGPRRAASRHLRRLLDRGAPASCAATGRCCPTCSHDLAGLVDDESDDATDAAKLLDQAAESKMAKGEVLVAHLVGTGADARVVAVERHFP